MLCRETHGKFDHGTFNLWACSLCYMYLFKGQTGLKHNWNIRNPGLVHKDTNLSLPIVDYLSPNISDKNAVSEICKTLDNSQCIMWTDCCNAAKHCCNEMQRIPKLPMGHGGCPRTWDGFGCFMDTNPGQDASIACPSYIELASTSGKAIIFYGSRHFTFN